MKVIVSHMNIDFDGLACLLAAQKLHKEAIVALTDKQQETVKSFLAIYRDRLNFLPYDRIDWENMTSLVLVDVASIKRTGIPEERLPRSFETIIYDHHSPKDGDVMTGERHIEQVGAGVTILIKKLIEQKVAITSFEATLFGLGIYTDTGNFTYAQVTARDLIAAANLIELGMDVTLVESFAEKSLSAEEKDLLQTLLQKSEEITLDGLTVLLTSHEQDVYQGGVSTLTRKMIETTDVDAAITIIKMKHDVHVITRSQTTRIDFRPLIESLGGGGHAQAASATLKKNLLAPVYSFIKNNLSRIITHALTAKEIMASPVKSVLPTAKINDVLNEMFQFGHTGFPVVDEDDKLVGVISRRDVDKATHHGLGHAPVKAYMANRPITLGPNASLEEIQTTMMEHNIGRIPIVENEKMIGILTRTNVIEQLHKQKTGEEATAMTSEKMIERMKSLLPNDIFHLLEKVGELADKQNLDIYLIGGIVRDFLLNRENEDIDLVIEGDGIAFAKSLANELGGTIIAHDTFGTATWESPIGVNVDVVTCRTEYYNAPGQLPIIRPSNIREDLRRRDFTINAMAIRINKQYFGQLLDYFQGEQDLKEKKIRILHTLSFIDDPTRIFRAVRFALRFNYTLDDQTKELATHSASTLKEISPERLERELQLIINEGFCINGMKMLDELTVFEALFQTKPKRKAWDRLRRVMLHDAVTPFLTLLTLLYGENNWLQLLNRYALTLEQRKLLEQIEFIEKQPVNPKQQLGEIHQLLHATSDDILLLYAVLTEQLFLFEYVQARKKLTPLLNGRDLIDLNLKPGPYFSKLLLQVASLQLDQKLTTKEEAIHWLLAEVKQSYT